MQADICVAAWSPAGFAVAVGWPRFTDEPVSLLPQGRAEAGVLFNERGFTGLMDQLDAILPRMMAVGELSSALRAIPRQGCCHTWLFVIECSCAAQS